VVAQDELYGERDLSYSVWHREASVRRFISDAEAHGLTCIDVDATLWCEWHSGTKEPLLFIETARDIGQQSKPVTVLTRLAETSGRAGYLVLYRLSDAPCFAYPDLGCAREIDGFRVRRVWPEPEPETEMTPEEYARYLVRERERMLRSLYGRLRPPAERKE